MCLSGTPPHSEPGPPGKVCIIGAGIVGAATAYFLSRLPHPPQVTVLEASGVAAGASGKSGGFLAEDWHGHETSDLARLSMQLHAQLAAEHDGPRQWGYRRVSALSVDLRSPGPSKPASIPSELATWLDPSIVASSSILGTPSTCAQVHPRLLTEKLLELSCAQIVHSSAVEIFWASTPGASPVTGVKTSAKYIVDCDTVFLAAGPWIGTVAVHLLPISLSQRLSKISGSRAHSIVIRPPPGLAALSPHALFTSLRIGAAGSPTYEPEVYPRPDGTAYVCGAGDSEPLPRLASEVVVSAERISALKAQAFTISPRAFGASAAVVEAEQACYLPVNKGGTGAPIIGKVCEGVYVGGGLSCWGITLAPGVGKCFSELWSEGKATSADISMLSP